MLPSHLLTGKQNALFTFVGIRGCWGGGILPGNGNTACFNFTTKNKAFLLFIRTLKGGPHGHSSNFFETTNKRNSLRPFHEKQKEKILYSAKINAILCLSSQSLTQVSLACVLLTRASAAIISLGTHPFEKLGLRLRRR